jgi:hypothetical protein
VVGAALAVGVAAVAARPARADDTHECISASDEGQTLRNDHKLAAAIDRFALCARDSCPALIRTTCQQWLAEVNAQRPSVVLGVRDPAGHDLIRVRVSVDGVLVTSTLDGSPLRVDPGQHVFRFEADGFVPQEQTVLARQGEANREVTVVLASTSPSPSSDETLRAGGALSSAPAGNDAGRVGATPDRSARMWNTTGWVLGGAGVIGLGVGAVFGVLAVVDNHNADCNAEKQCLPGPLSEARTAAVGADIGLIAGGVLLAGGVTLVLLTPKKSAGSTAGVNVTPLAGPGRAGLALGARW